MTITLRPIAAALCALSLVAAPAAAQSRDTERWTARFRSNPAGRFA